MFTIPNWIIFGALVGSLGTYLFHDYKGFNGQIGALWGGLIVAVGNLVFLIPLWAYIFGARCAIW
jgi:hypothetical protein